MGERCVPRAATASRAGRSAAAVGCSQYPFRRASLRARRIPGYLQPMRIASYVNRNTVRTAALLIGAGFLLGAISAGHMLVTRMGTDRGYTPGHALIMATPIWVV